MADEPMHQQYLNTVIIVIQDLIAVATLEVLFGLQATSTFLILSGPPMI